METKQARRKERRDARTPQVFAIRLPWPSNRFGWEIRRYGCFVLLESGISFGTLAEARAAGEAMLSEDAA